MNTLLGLIRDERGATAVEYGLIVGAIAGLVIAVALGIGGKMANAFNNIQSAIP